MRRILAAGLVLLAGACASPPHGGPPPGGGPGGPSVFISPMGQPFRGGPGRPAPLIAWFEGADADHDGALTLSEFQADAAAFFAVLDSNGDGVIDSAENRVYEERIAPEIVGLGLRGGPGGGGRGGRPPRLNMAQREGGPDGGGPGGPGGGRGGRGGPPRGGRGGGGGMNMMQGAAPYGLLGDAQPVRSADADQSQSVSAAEFQAAAKRRFQRLDKDGDGMIRLADLQPPGRTRR